VKLEHRAEGLEKNSPAAVLALQGSRPGAPRAHRAGLHPERRPPRAASPDIRPPDSAIFRAYFPFDLAAGKVQAAREWESGNILGPPGEAAGGAPRVWFVFPAANAPNKLWLTPSPSP